MKFRASKTTKTEIIQVEAEFGPPPPQPRKRTFLSAKHCLLLAALLNTGEMHSVCECNKSIDKSEEASNVQR